ncbi:CLUMA_CG018161, isoform A [Clunio marinus]|uniref:CLUMA_CG018161, isoform A n=1 Tax=Clunio marinus TaxID=568069 RepID=A0A1J1IXT0_9DIPT|nr:CLUMA_CG018161, isoform A [Clunio marinus]
MSEQIKIEDFKLSTELIGHSLDVRSVATSNGCIISGSRDKTAKIWDRNEDGKTYKEAEVLRNHSNFVSAVFVFNNGKWIATASNDKTICLYNFGLAQPFATLTDHTETVCALAQGLSPAILVSGSWDKTARIWTKLDVDASSIELKGHDAAVWAVIALKNGKYATGSADKNIYVWNEKGERLVVLKGHTDCIRGLASFPNGSLLSASNDATIRLWNDTYDCVKEFHGHSNYIYAIALNPILGDDVFVTGSEDNTIRLWSASKGALGDALTLPVQSIWSVACTENGDIVSGASDGVVRVFSKDKNRIANEEVLSAFTLAVETRKAEQSAELGGVKVNDLPGPESLLQEGTEGQTRLVRQPNGKILCYQWTKGNWECVGDVMGATGGTKETSGKSLHEGKEYDFVFNVDIEDGVPPLKLPFNRTEDPWFAAQKFIHANDLPQAYLEQVANFIIKNANLESLPPVGADDDFFDPFTGEGRYVPSSNGNEVPASSSVGVNFRERSNNAGIINVDPFTGGDSYSSGKKEFIIKKHIPSTTLVTFDAYDATKILAKLKEFNNQVNDDLKQSEDALASVTALIDSKNVNKSAIDHLEQMLCWPSEKLFPVLDVVRLIVRNQQICSSLSLKFIESIMKNLTTTPPNQLMSIRALCNIIVHDWGRGIVEGNVIQITDQILKMTQGNGNLQIAIGTFFLNQSILQKDSPSDEITTTLSIGIVKFLEWASDPEATFRVYQALGNLITFNSSSVLSIIKSVDRFKSDVERNLQAQLSKLAEISLELTEKLM